MSPLTGTATVSMQAVEEILSRYPWRAQPVSPPQPLGGAGGLSGARLWRYPSAQGPLVLRAWPPHGTGREHIERVHRWLLMTADLGFIPIPIRDQQGRTIGEYDGRLWEITPWLAGAADLTLPPSSAHLRRAFKGLAAFHQRLAEERIEGPSPGLRQRFEAVNQLELGGFDTLERAIERRRGRDLSNCEAAMLWIRLARTTAPQVREPLRHASSRSVMLQPCLRDARPEHFLFEGDQLSGLVDFGAMAVDSVVGDLARLIGEWLNDDRPAYRLALQCYEEIRPLAPVETSLIGPFKSAMALLSGERWIRWHFIEERGFDDRSAVTRGIARSIEQLQRLAFKTSEPRLID
jgi:Ser/Thr protein kinase RdoA (MazF antagonist)